MNPSHAAGPGRRGNAPLILALALAATVVAMAQTQVVPILTQLGDKLDTGSAGVGWITTAAA
ncbi:hypothetical protein [Streptomyces sp. NPDC005969]|uniref:hypothetical protein n=1 Tax=Streptomyces sp. NPDC005969 TaxID=3156722 RepID=UPI0033FDFEAF